MDPGAATLILRAARRPDRRPFLALAFLLGAVCAPSPEAFASGTTADRVLGQVSLALNRENLVDERGLAFPWGTAIDRSVTPSRIYVADTENNRVLAWADAAAFMNGDPADLVIGQPDFFSFACNNGGVSANSLCL